MSLPRYPKYADSGIDWLREIPEHWTVLPLKALIDRIESGTSVNSIDSPASTDSIGVLKTSCVYGGVFDVSENKTVVEEETDRVTCQLRRGTLIVSRMNTPELIGAAGYVRESRPNIYLPDRLWQVSLRGVDVSFVHYWTMTPLYRSVVQAVSTGTSSSMKNLAQGDFSALRLATPPNEEQRSIVNFLDTEVGHLDALLAEQDRLIKLLREKRQAVISHAVTKGIDRDAHMMDAGVEWLGNIPAHWELVGLTKYLDSLVDYRGRTPTKVEQGIFLVTARNIRQGIIDYAASEELIDASEYADVMRRGRPNVGDVLFTTEAPLGQVANVDRTDIALAQRIIKLRGKTGVVDSYFLKYWMMGEFSQADMLRLATGSTALGIKGSKMGQLRLCLPPIEEQRQIVQFLDTAVSKVDRLVGEAERVISLIRERRSALITAAITGQIDVRGLVEPAAA